MRYITTLVMMLSFAAGSITAQQRTWTLEECIDKALEGNTAVRQQQLSAEYQRNLLAQSKFGLLPTLSGNVAYNTAFGRALDETTYSFIENETVRSGQVYAGSSLTLFNGLRNYNTIIKSRYEVVAAGYDLERIKNNITLSVTLAYLQILLTRELAEIAENQLTSTRNQIVKISSLVSAGSLTRGSLLDIEAQAAREELHLVTTRNQLGMALLNLAQLLELESADGLDIMKPSSVVLETVILPDDPENVYAVALGSRPEILSAQTRHDIAGADLRIALGGQSPKLTLNSAFSTGYSDARRRLLGTDPVTGPVYGPYPAADQFSDNISYGIGLSLSVPILNGWRVRSDIRNARLGIMQTDIMLDETRKQLYREIQQASADAVAALRKYEAGGRAVEASEEAFMYAEQRFSAGSVTSVEYNAAKTNLLNSQSELLQARYEYIFKTKVLDFYKGIPVTLK